MIPIWVYCDKVTINEYISYDYMMFDIKTQMIVIDI